MESTEIHAPEGVMVGTPGAVAGSEAWLLEQRCIALDTITDFAYVFDLRGRLTFVNKPLLDLWGIPLEQAIGKTFSTLVQFEAMPGRTGQAT